MADPVRRKQQCQKTIDYHRMKKENDLEYASKSKARANRYYHKKKNDPEYLEKNRVYSLTRYYERKNDPERHKEHLSQNRERRRIRKQNDPDFAIRCHLRERLSNLVRKGNLKRERSAIDLIGITVAELRVHLENQFRRGMSWGNYGRVWHIDHIIPCSKFDLTDLRQQSICFNYLNLRPLWAKENLRKGARILEDSQLPLGI